MDILDADIKAGWTPEGREALALLLAEAKDDNLSTLDAREADPLEEAFIIAGNRALAKEIKYIPITPQQKVAQFPRMAFEPTAKQLEIALDPHMIRSVRAGRRSGKSTLAAAEAAATLVGRPGSFGWVVGPDYDLAFRCWTMVIEHLQYMERHGECRIIALSNTPTRMRVVLDNGSWCEGQSVENAQDLQGVQLDFVVIDEIAQVEQFVFTEFLFPALAEKNGWAFLIGTPMGDSWASESTRRHNLEDARAERESAWVEYVFETWHNTIAFPGGRNDPKILLMERTMNYDEFMEQVCAQPQKSRYVVYKEFDSRIHVRNCRFNPDFPVQLSIDPSSGPNPYAVGVFQDHGPIVEVIDEYYKTGVLADDVIDDLRHRPWWSAVEEAIIDDAWPHELKVWGRRQECDHISIRRANKASWIEENIPLVRQWLRDPLRYNRLIEPIREKIGAEMFPGKTWQELEYPDQKQVMIRAEYEAAALPEIVIECANLFVDYHCENICNEFLGYMYRQPKRDKSNVSENPIKKNDHLMDCIRYYLTERKESYGEGRFAPYSYTAA